MYYYLVIGLQIYCAYHAYTNRNPIYWYLIIFLAPGLGSLIYLITQVFTKKDADKVQREITAIVNPTKKIKDLEKKLAFSDTFQNRIDLADAYFENSNFEKAIENYEKALKGNHKEDFYGISRCIKAYYSNEQYNEAIAIAEIIQHRPEFEKSKSQFIYGLALWKIGQTKNANTLLNKINQRYSNYNERLQLSQFLIENNNISEAKDILTEILEEHKHMTPANKRKHRNTFIKIKETLKNLDS